MKESFDDPTILDTLAWPVRYFRATMQMFWAGGIIATDQSDVDFEETISITFGWGTKTCLDQFDQFNTFGQWVIRFGSLPWAVYLWWLYMHLPVEPGTTVIAQVVHWWILGQIVLLAAYDPLAGLVDLAPSATPEEVPQ